MSNSLSLDDLRSDLDREYAPVVVDGITLRNLLRVSEKERAVVSEALEAMDSVKQEAGEEEGTANVSAEDAEKVSDALYTILRTVAADGRGDELVEKLGDDMMLAMKVLEHWVEATQPGEAGNSPA